MEKYSIRVVVPCFDSDLTIEKCISSILSSKEVDFELFIIDDGKNNVLYSLKRDRPMCIIKTSGMEGAGKARNAGAHGFKGRIVVFIDSDVQIFPDTLSDLIKPLKENSAEATVGSYKRHRGNNFFDSYKQYYLAFRYNNPEKYLSNTFWSAICALDYRTFEEAGGFKECFAGAGPEDIDLGVTLSEHGARILSVPQAMGIHLSRFSFIKLLKNDFRKGSEDIYIHLVRKIPIMENRHVNMAEILAVFLACSTLLLLLFLPVAGIIPSLISMFLYCISRIRFVKNAFGGEAPLFVLKSFFLTYLLDIIKGFAVINGTLLCILETISSGKYKPFARLTS